MFSQVAAPPNLCWQKGPQSSRLSERQVGEKLQSCCNFHIPHSRHILPQHVTEALSDQEKLCCYLCQTRKSYVVISVRPRKATLSSLSDQEKLRHLLCRTRKGYVVISVRPGKVTLSSLSHQEKRPCHLCQTRKVTLSSLSNEENIFCDLCQTRKENFVIKHSACH